MKTIVISGSHSNIGKTSMAESLIREFPGWSALKVTLRHGARGSKRARCPRNKSCRACTSFKGDFDVVTDRRIINQKGKDTSRFKKAGAKKVAWLRATPKGLKRGLKESFLELRDSEGLIIEGTSVLKHLKPDIAIYIKASRQHIKQSAGYAEKKSDIIVNACP